MTPNGDCTVFNRVYDPKERSYHWQATVIKDVLWQGGSRARGERKGGIGVTENQESTIFIPFDTKSSRPFLSEQEFLLNPEKGFTLRPEDKIARGALWTEMGSESMTILSVETFDFGRTDMQHWEVGAG